MGGGFGGSPLASGASGAKQEMFCGGCQCASDQALQTDLLPGNAAVLQTAGKPDSNAERRSSLHVNRGDFTTDWLGCLNTPGTLHYELWLLWLFR